MSILQFKIKTLSSEGNMTLCMRPAETTKAKIDPKDFKYQNRKLSWLLCLKKQKRNKLKNIPGNRKESPTIFYKESNRIYKIKNTIL